ncbi:hypothetical protein, partial [Pigmentiphaga sp. NML030171]|uniref:hypothetical protein n=1 Tax=Pigmentiphaga sp. NML030171 TaxID=2008676 RepID=UPI001C3DC8F2
FVPMLLNQPYRTFTYFRGKLVVLAHGSIFSRIGASSKTGSIQSRNGQTPPTTSSCPGLRMDAAFFLSAISS